MLFHSKPKTWNRTSTRLRRERWQCGYFYLFLPKPQIPSTNINLSSIIALYAHHIILSVQQFWKKSRIKGDKSRISSRILNVIWNHFGVEQFPASVWLAGLYRRPRLAISKRLVRLFPGYLSIWGSRQLLCTGDKSWKRETFAEFHKDSYKG